VPVPFVTLTNDLALEDFQRGKERGRAVAFVVVSHSAATAFFERQARLRSIQSLNRVARHIVSWGMVSKYFVSKEGMWSRCFVGCRQK